jgi:cell division protein FtsI/penicillin-binding protein 2
VTASCSANATANGSPSASGNGSATGSPGSSSSGSQVVWIYSTTATLNKASDDKWHVAWAPAIFAPNLTAAEHLVLATVPAKRGDIVGANNTPLMTSRAIVQVGIDKTKLSADQVASSAQALAQVVGVDAGAYTRSVTAAGPKAFVAVTTVRADDSLVTARAGDIAAIPGAVTIPGTSVIGPTPNFARSLLGTVGEATSDAIAKSGGTLKPGDVVGLSGLEQRYDARLRGSPGVAIQAVGTDASGKTTKRDLFSSPPVDGKPLVITLDATAQTVAEAVLQQGPQDVASALVAIRPSTGEIVASANGPGSKGLPIGTTGQAAPGSTFKIISALALLRAGLTPDTTVPCTASVTVGGRAFKNYNDYPASKLGDIPLRTAFANSCNTAFIASATKVSQGDLAAAAAALGIGVDLDLGFPAYLGSVPDTATTTEHAASMIGQAKVLVAPMDMATVVASVVRGSVVRPKLLDDNPAVASFPNPDKPLQPAEAQALQAMMAAVVSEGSGAILADVGVTAAKTGTAEFGTATPPQTHAWMVAARGDLAVAVYVEVGESGSRTAGPLLKGFLQAYAG